jgi:hypothetical protein
MSELSDSGQLQQPALDVSLSIADQSALASRETPFAEQALPVAVPAEATDAAQSITAIPFAKPEVEAIGPLSERAPLTPTSSSPTAPAITPWRRLWRVLSGTALLALAWGLLLVLISLTNAAWSFLHGPRALLLRAGASAGAALGVLWLAVAVIACLLAGAYCLMLAVTRRSW